jgi:predicted transcriptional regulator
MTRLTLDLPEDLLKRLERLAQARRISVSQLFEDMSSVLLAEADAETRFRLRAGRGAGQEGRGLTLLSQAARRTRGASSSKEDD